MVKYRADVFGMCETQCDWSMAEHDQQLGNIILKEKQKRLAVGYNEQDKGIQRDQHGGMAIMALDRMANHVLDVGVVLNPSELAATPTRDTTRDLH